MKEILFSDLWYWLVLCAVVCYFIGCFNFAVIISHFKKSDIRNIGSGNPGTMNMTRTFGLKIGVINFVLDAVKGGIPAIIGWAVFRNYIFAGSAIVDIDGGIVGGVFVSDFIRYFCGVFVIIGHIFPVTMKFKGGKGIASTLGLFVLALPCEPQVWVWWYLPIAVLGLVLIYTYIALTEWGSMGSLIGVSGFTIWQAGIIVARYSDMLLNPWVISLLMILLMINIITWGAHRKNVYKLLAGEEHRTSVKKLKSKKQKTGS